MMKKTMISAVFAITVMIVAIFATHQNAMAGSDYSARDFVFSNYPNPELQSDGRYMVERFLGECSRFIEPNWGKYKAKAAIYMTSPNVVATSIMIS
ncbi:MAG: hypothetical protein ORN98_02620, partial [Alphaproteobacteria bacterium]|nr:hypothetical protein [Alphaproteobacteria bacterium]